MLKIIAFGFLVAAGCGGNPKANACATKGASYVVHAAEISGGTCGTVPDQLVNVSSDGVIGSASTATVTCKQDENDGCTVRKSGCSTTNQGVTCTSASSLTFAKDGTSASGGLTLNCSGSASCVSSYDVTYTRH